jgi:hypothetical protein
MPGPLGEFGDHLARIQQHHPDIVGSELLIATLR